MNKRRTVGLYQINYNTGRKKEVTENINIKNQAGSGRAYLRSWLPVLVCTSWVVQGWVTSLTGTVISGRKRFQTSRENIGTRIIPRILPIWIQTGQAPFHS